MDVLLRYPVHLSKASHQDSIVADVRVPWGPPITIVAIFATLLGVTVASLIQAFSHVKEETEFRTKTVDRLDKIDERLRVLTVSSAGATPNNPASQAQARDIITEVKKNRVEPLPKPTVQLVGTQFVNASTCGGSVS